MVAWIVLFLVVVVSFVGMLWCEIVKKDDEKSNAFWSVFKVCGAAAIFAVLITVLIGGSYSYDAYALERGDITVELAALPASAQTDTNLYIRSGRYLEGGSYYYYATKELDGTKCTHKENSKNLYVDKRDGEDPHLEIYSVKGFKDWYRYIYATPKFAEKYTVIVVPESEDIKDTFNPR